ncbi:MAG TPA: Ldh family oxidoreductase [Candidatus Angelobacter sp.]|jgi:LDH2 family malate/lactate/ureidoglycolate dehydrogenase|nr:Ldh family oxidoreductase [Candidatus Angelobacter sp.]
MKNLYPTRVDPQKLSLFCIAAMQACGMKEEDARVTAEVLVNADLWGTFTHGTNSLYRYLRKIRLGGIDPSASPEVLRESPGWAIIDGHAAMGMVTAAKAMRLAIQKAKSTGIAYVGVKNGSHFGAAGCYANMAAESQMIGLAMSNADPNMAAPGGTTSVIGNNPLAVAIPTGSEKTIMLDIAMSTAAAGKIHAAKRLGVPIPGDWLVDGDGTPTADYSRWPEVGSMLPMGGHKGYGLALMIESLAAVLTGAGVTAQVTSWSRNLRSRTNTGHAFIAIDVGAMMPLDEFKQRVDRMIREIRESPKASWAKRIYLPGEIEWEKRDEALAHGIAFPQDVIETLTQIAKEFNMDISRIFI